MVLASHIEREKDMRILNSVSETLPGPSFSGQAIGGPVTVIAVLTCVVFDAMFGILRGYVQREGSLMRPEGRSGKSASRLNISS